MNFFIFSSNFFNSFQSILFSSFSHTVFFLISIKLFCYFNLIFFWIEFNFFFQFNKTFFFALLKLCCILVELFFVLESNFFWFQSKLFLFWSIFFSFSGGSFLFQSNFLVKQTNSCCKRSTCTSFKFNHMQYVVQRVHIRGDVNALKSQTNDDGIKLVTKYIQMNLRVMRYDNPMIESRWEVKIVKKIRAVSLWSNVELRVVMFDWEKFSRASFNNAVMFDFEWWFLTRIVCHVVWRKVWLKVVIFESLTSTFVCNKKSPLLIKQYGDVCSQHSDD